jgi:GntR family transcriptional regulator/MocR family aminotransferase
MSWDFVLQLNPQWRGSLPQKIARAVADEIRRGRLAPGDQLPSTRKLATQLGVQRKAVVAAFLALAREGWITTERAKGTFVSLELPTRAESPAKAMPRAAAFRLPRLALPGSAASRRAELLLFGGVPDLSFVPRAELARAYRRALEGRGGRKLLDYGADPRGEPRLREAVGEMLTRSRGVRATPDTINIVRGTQQGMYLAARTLLQPGDCVAVEAYSHPAFRNVFPLVGVEVVPVPVDREGLDVAALEALCATRRVHAVYLTPHHQLPTTVTLSAPRRMRLLELAHKRGMLVLEDDYDHEFQYEGSPVLPLAHADPYGVVVYFGTLSKVLAPGLRLGFVASTPEVSERIAGYRAYVDQQGDQALERAVAELIEDGEVERHVRRARRLYRARRDAFAEALRRHVPELAFTPPSGGMAIWAQAPGVDVDAWVERALADGVAFQAASHFALGPAPRDFARLGFAACDEAQLLEAARRLGKAYPKAAASRRKATAR